MAEERKRNADGSFRKKRKKSSSLNGVATTTRRRAANYVSTKKPQFIDGAKKGAAILGGMVAGSVLRGVVNKVMPTTATTGVNASGLIVDAALIFGGVMLSSSTKNEAIKYVGYGIAANGAAGAIKSVTGKDFLATGLSGTDVTSLVSGFGDANDPYQIGAAQMIDLDKLPIAPASTVNGMGEADPYRVQLNGDSDMMAGYDSLVA